jgi:hypothetical protein
LRSKNYTPSVKGWPLRRWIPGKRSLDRCPYGVGRIGRRKIVEHRHPELDLFVLVPAALALRQVQFGALCVARAEFTVNMSRQLMGNVPVKHFHFVAPTEAFKYSASILWPRLRRDATVPMEQ